MIAALVEDKTTLNAAIVAKGDDRASRWAAIADARQAMLPIVHKWREALQSDGWTMAPTYGHEPLDHAWTAKRDGFAVTGLARPIPGAHKTVPKPDINAWGPDGAVIELPDEYAFDKLQAAMFRCGECGKSPVETKRYAFANRCCAECGPKLMASLPSNWAE